MTCATKPEASTWYLPNHLVPAKSFVRGVNHVLRVGLWGFSFKRMKKHSYRSNCRDFFSFSKHAGMVKLWPCLFIAKN